MIVSIVISPYTDFAPMENESAAEADALMRHLIVHKTTTTTIKMTFEFEQL